VYDSLVVQEGTTWRELVEDLCSAAEALSELTAEWGESEGDQVIVFPKGGTVIPFPQKKRSRAGSAA
jgi:hypothetical protein